MKKIYEIKVCLEYTHPPVWRRLAVPDSLTLYELHHIIQLAFGWMNIHLYLFTVSRERYGNPHLVDDFETNDDKETTIGEILLKPKDRIKYEYDFGDSWNHTIILEKITPDDEKLKYALCLEGKMACPPEDCGGIPGFEHLKEVMRDKKHEEYAEMVEWLGYHFDPEEFHLVEVNKDLKNLKKWIKKYEADW